MKGFCYLILTQPVGVHGIPNAVSDSPGLSSFEELLLLSPHFHLAKSFGFSIEERPGCIMRVCPLGSQDGHHHENHPQNWSRDQLRGCKKISNSDCRNPGATAWHTDEHMANPVDCTDDASAQNVGFCQAPQVTKDRTPSWVLRSIGDCVS